MIATPATDIFGKSLCLDCTVNKDKTFYAEDCHIREHKPLKKELEYWLEQRIQYKNNRK